ncbi:MAG: DNA-binding protein [Nodosilinea sp.]
MNLAEMTTNRNEFQDRLFNELEYTSIRDEILKRMELRLQIMSVTLTLAGAFIGFGVSNTLLSLVYPPLAALLAMLWVQNDTRSRQLGKYIQSDDAVHIALATVNSLNYLLTWNCKHIANAQIRRKLLEICSDFGYTLPIICTPYELMGE